MNSSISSFKIELKAIALVLVALLAVEVGIRWLEPMLSLDIVHTREMPKIAQALYKSPGTHVLFLGNSLTRQGVDPKVVANVLEDQGLDNVSLARIYPDDTEVLDWYYVFKHVFSDTHKPPDILIISFALDHLADKPVRPEQTRRIAQHYVHPRDVPGLFAVDLTTVGQRGDFLLSAALSSFANRERVRTRILDIAVPYYREIARDMNNTLKETAPTATTSRGDGYSYIRLERLLEMAANAGTQVVVVAMPIPKLYGLDPNLLTVLNRERVPFLDLRSVEGLSEDDFPDGYHLGQEGAITYSRVLASKLAPLLETLQP